MESGRKQETIVGSFFSLSLFIFPSATVEVTRRSQHLSVPSSVLQAFRPKLRLLMKFVFLESEYASVFLSSQLSLGPVSGWLWGTL